MSVLLNKQAAWFHSHIGLYSHRRLGPARNHENAVSVLIVLGHPSYFRSAIQLTFALEENTTTTSGQA